MFYFSKLCILCLNTYKHLKTILIQDNKGILVQTKLKYCLPEIVDSHLEIPKYICSSCISKLDCFYQFKQWCLQNNTNLNNFLQTLTSGDETFKHLSVKLTDIQHENKLQQTLLNVGSNEELQIELGGNICIKEAETVVENKIKLADVLNIQESHSSDEENCIIVKEESVTFDDNADDEFYNELVMNIKSESNTSDSNVSSLNIENITDEFKDSINSKKENTATSSEFTKENNIQKTKPYQCTICDKKFTRCDSLTQHKLIHAGVKKYKCLVCERKFTYKSNLVDHIFSHTGIKRYKCSICTKQFTQSSGLKTHEKIHKGIKDYKCLICKRVFTQKSCLMTHELIHKETKQYECPICKKRFTQKSTLSTHEKIHTGVKNYKCSTCEKTFSQKSSLDSHLRIHAGTNFKTFECLICNKKFALRNNLTKHELIHTGDKPFECKICNKKFRYKSNLTVHETVHTGAKNFQCAICQQKFTQKSSLVVHEKIHTGVKNFKCAVCDKRFRQKHNCLNHEKTQHNPNFRGRKYVRKSTPQKNVADGIDGIWEGQE